MIKTNNNNKSVTKSVTKSASVTKRSKSGVINDLVKELLAPSAPAPAPIPEVISAPAPIPVQSAVTLSEDTEVIGVPNLRSKRIAPGTPLSEYRVVPNQRKGVRARYYVQGGTLRIDPVTRREMFYVCVEIPHTDLYTAKLQLVQLRSDLTRSLAPAKTA